jgi:ParB family chromosome partitioning protein
MVRSRFARRSSAAGVAIMKNVSAEIDKIAIGRRHRQEMGDLDALAQNIEEQGLLHPIGITEDYELVFGSGGCSPVVTSLAGQRLTLASSM